MADGDYHLVVLVWVATPDGRLVVTRRHPDKPWPLLWECTGGSVLAGEDSLRAALREVREETGLALDPARGRVVDSYAGDDTIYDSWLFDHDVRLEDTAMQEGEVVDIKLAFPAEIEALFSRGEFVPTLEGPFKAVQASMGARRG